MKMYEIGKTHEEQNASDHVPKKRLHLYSFALLEYSRK